MPKIYPVHARVVDPRTMRPVPKSGLNVALTLYWRRRIAMGEATLEAPSAPKKKKTSPQKGDA